MSSLSRFVDLFNGANGVNPPLTAAELDIGKPVTIAVDEDGNNTTVTVVGKVKEGFTVNVTFKYIRVDVIKLLLAVELTAIVPHGINTARQAMASINTQFGLDIPLEDVIDNVIQFPTATIQLDPESYEWFGSLEVTLEHRAVDINVDLLDGDLDGFNYPQVNFNQ